MQNNKVTLSIYSTPPGATIYENGQYIGETPVTLTYTATPQFYRYGSMPIQELYAVWKSGAQSDFTATELYSQYSNYQQITFTRPENHPNLELDVDYGRKLENDAKAQQQIKQEQDLQRLNRVNKYLQNLPGGSNYNKPRSCPFLSGQTSDLMNTYCIYQCNDGTTKTVKKIKGMGCI